MLKGLKGKIDPNLVDGFTKTKFFSFIDKLEATQRFLLVIIGIMGAAIIVLSFTMYKTSMVSRTLVLPPKVDKEFWVSGSAMSQSYYEQVGFYIADRIMSVSPATAESSYDTLLPFFSSNSIELAAIKKKLKEQAEFIKKENIYQVFYPTEAIPDVRKRVLSVNGSLRKYIGEMYIHELETRLDIVFDIINGRFVIKKLETGK